MYITIILCTLIVGATVLGWKYFSSDFAAEAIQDQQLDSISVICAKLKDRINKYEDADASGKETVKITYEEFCDAIEDIYTISTRDYEPNND